MGELTWLSPGEIEQKPVTKGAEFVEVGRCIAINPEPIPPKKIGSDGARREIESDPTLNSFTWPERGPIAESESLEYQASRFQDSKPPSETRIHNALKYVGAHYPRAKVPKYFEGPKHSVSRADVEAVFPSMNLKSSPGVPWHSLGKTKGEVIEKHKELLIDAVLARLDILESGIFSTNPSFDDAVFLVRIGAVDPVRLFVKNEPHNIDKARMKRWRLISSVSVVDEIIERLLCSAQNELEIQNWTTCPSKPGMGLTDDSAILHLWKVIKKHLDDKDVANSDVRGWDWSVKWWLWKMEIDARIFLSGATPASSFARILSNRIWCLARSVFARSDGRLLAQKIAGLMKSGSYLTSSSNSRMRVMLAIIVGAPWAMAMGDDAVEGKVENAKEKYRSYGFDLKEYEICDSVVEFCSHRFENGTAIPLNDAKMTYKHLSSEQDEFSYLQFLFELRNSPKLLLRQQQVIRAAGWTDAE